VAAAAVERIASGAAGAGPNAPALGTDEDSAAADCDTQCGDADEVSDFSYTDSDDEEDDGGFWGAVLDSDARMTIDNGEPRHVRAHVRRGQAVFWFRDGGDEYWIEDPALVDEVRQATRPMRDLGQEMGRLGAEMGRHGASMGRIGGQMGAIGAR